MNHSYALDSDSSHWWWPQAAAGAVAAAAITVILVVPATGVEAPDPNGRGVAPTPAFRLDTVDPAVDRPCFLTRAQWNVALDQAQPRCGYLPTANREQRTGTPRPGLGVLP